MWWSRYSILYTTCRFDKSTFRSIIPKDLKLILIRAWLNTCTHIRRNLLVKPLWMSGKWICVWSGRLLGSESLSTRMSMNPMYVVVGHSHKIIKMIARYFFFLSSMIPSPHFFSFSFYFCFFFFFPYAEWSLGTCLETTWLPWRLQMRCL